MLEVCGFIETSKPGKYGLNQKEICSVLSKWVLCAQRGLLGLLFCHQHKFMTWDMNRIWVCSRINYLFKRVWVSWFSQVTGEFCGGNW